MSNVYDWWHVLSNWSLFIGRVNYPTISHSTNATWGPLSFVSKSLPLTICNTPDFGTPPRFNHETYCNHIGITPPKTKKHRPLNYEIVGRQKTHHLNFPLEKNMRLICRGGGGRKLVQNFSRDIFLGQNLQASLPRGTASLMWPATS